MLTYFFNSQYPSVENLPKGLPSGRIGLRTPKRKKISNNNYKRITKIIIMIITVIIIFIIMIIIIITIYIIIIYNI